MATQKHAFMETDHPLVRRIWKMLEEEIPAEFLEATTFGTSTMFQKSAAEANKLRRIGKRCSFEFDCFDAMPYLSRSVATAPDDSEELALAYDDRSSLLWCRTLYDLYLLDANRALDGPRPLFTTEDFWDRKDAACKKLLQQKILRLKMRESITQFKRRHGQRAELNACERKLGYASKVGVNDSDLVIDHSRLDDPIWKTATDNTVPKYISPKIVLKMDAQLGPYFIAKEDILPGEILCTDELYSSSLYGHLKYEYCDYCHFQCAALIPCYDCSWNMYCTEACRDKAYDSYHRTECQMPPAWSDTDVSSRELRTLLLRTFLQVTKQGTELVNLMNSPLVREALDGNLDCSNVPYSTENYLIVAGVVSRLRYSNHENMTCDPVMIKDTLAVFAALRSIQFFGNEDTEIQRFGNVLNAQEYFGIMLLVYQISLMIPQFFHLGVYMVDSLAAPSRGRYTSLGLGLNLWQCLTLHSCNPNASKILNKRHMLTYSVRSIKAGEQICPLGLQEFMKHPRAVRRDLMKAYGCPECACRACDEDWPVLTEFEQRDERYRTDNKTIIWIIERARAWLLKNRTRPINDYYLKGVFSLLSTIREYVEEPSATIVLCEFYIERFMLSKGNMQMDPK